MGFFDKLKNDKKIGVSRNDDKIGRYWQRVDKVEVAESQDGVEYLRMHKTTIRTLSGDLLPGDETTEVYFTDKFGYTERDLRSLMQGAFDLDIDAVNALTFKAIGKTLVKDGALNGMVCEVRITGRPSKDGEKVFLNTKYVRAIPADELEEALATA